MPEAELRVGRDSWVVVDYVLYDEDGDVVEATDDEGGRPLGFVYGYGTLVPGLERALQGMRSGETKEVEVPPEEAYGPSNPELEHWVDRADFPGELEIDDEFEAEGDDGSAMTLRIVEITDDAVLVDANHPLAGETLRFDVMVRSVRPATPAEVAAARARAPKVRLSVVSGAAAGQPPPRESAEAPAEESAALEGSSGQTARPAELAAERRDEMGGTHPAAKGLRKDRKEQGRRGGTKTDVPAELDDDQ